jgi:hypothetical protein
MTQAEITRRIEELIKDRDAVVVKANQEIAFINGKIAMLEELQAKATEEKKKE